MPKYETRQRKILNDYFSHHVDENISAKQIASDLAQSGISVSAIYRNLNDMVGSGLIQRVALNADKSVYYRYIAADDCKSHLHMSCSKCGKTFHMDMHSTDNIIDQVNSTSDFKIDSSNTVLYGTCKNCRLAKRG